MIGAPSLLRPVGSGGELYRPRDVLSDSRVVSIV